MMLAMMIERGLLARLFGKSTPEEKAEVEAILANLSALRNEILTVKMTFILESSP